jgi:diguanylate cyclase (GGDEF)-like protein
MAKPPLILVVTEARADLRKLMGGDRPLGRRCVVRGWEDLARPAVLPRAPLAVVLPLNGARPRAGADLRALRQRFPGVPILAAGGSVRARPPRGTDGRLGLPLQALEVELLACRARRKARTEEEQGRLRGRLRRLERRLAALNDIARTAHSILEPARVTEIAARRLRELVGARLAVIYWLDEDTRSLVPSPAYGRGAARECSFILRLGEGAVGRVVQRRRALRLDGRALSRLAGEIFDSRMNTITRAYLGAPLISRGRVIGAIELRNRAGGQTFGRQEQEMVMGFVEPVAIAIDNALLFQRSQELSVTDDLTKLYNSRFLNDTLAREVKRARRYGSQVSLIFLDLDGFKTVNDRHGHLVGSRTLIEIGQVVRDAVREIDVVSRYGGDEFTVVLPQTGPDGAKVIAERIRQAIAERVFMEKEGLAVRLTASIGVASFPRPCDSPEELIQAADRAMYKVKGSTKNCVGMAE